MNDTDKITDARKRLSELKATAEKAIGSQNHHRILLVIVFSIAGVLLIWFLTMEILAGQAFTDSGTKDRSSNQAQLEQPPGDVQNVGEDNGVASKSAAGSPSIVSQPSALAKPSGAPATQPQKPPNYDSLQNAIASPIGIVFQGIFLVSVISLLIVRRAALRTVDTGDLKATEDKIERLEKALDACGSHLKAHIQKTGLHQHTLEGFVQLLEKNKDAQKALAPAVAESVDRLRASNAELTNILLQIESASDEAKGMYLSAERKTVGHILALVALFVAAMPLWIWIVYHRAIDHQGAYLALAAISCACVAAAHALLGRRKTDEARFIDDLRNLSTTVDVMGTLLKPIQISEHKSVLEPAKSATS